MASLHSLHRKGNVFSVPFRESVEVAGEGGCAIWTIEQLLDQVCAKGASDLIITVGTPPQLRILGDLQPLGNVDLLPADSEAICMSVLTESQKVLMAERSSLDFSKGFSGLSRFRFNVYRQRGSYALAARYIPFVVPSFEELGLPVDVFRRFSMRPHGLVLVTGAAGSGKSTSLASMIDYINEHRHAHVICLEDPIEYLHHHRKSTVEQREIYEDAPSFAAALRDVFRQSPDVIMVGEMRDMETMQLALTLAETGHLVMGTLHTQDTVQAISRIVDSFPAAHQQQIYTQLSMVLTGVVSQVLLMTADHRRRVLAYEVMLANTAIRNLIRERQVQQMYSVIQTSRDEGMSTMNESLCRLVRSGTIERKTAMERSTRPVELERMLETAT